MRHRRARPDSRAQGGGRRTERGRRERGAGRARAGARAGGHVGGGGSGGDAAAMRGRKHAGCRLARIIERSSRRGSTSSRPSRRRRACVLDMRAHARRDVDRDARRVGEPPRRGAELADAGERDLQLKRSATGDDARTRFANASARTSSAIVSRGGGDGRVARARDRGAPSWPTSAPARASRAGSRGRA